MVASFKRIKYFDSLKFFAIIAVLFNHCFNIINPLMFHGINFYHVYQLGRFGVPIFLCISGALLLNKDYEFIDFLKRRFARVGYPLLFFIVIAYIFQIYPNPFTAFWYGWMILGAYLTIPFINKIIQNSTIKEIEYFLAICLFASLFYQMMNYLKVDFSFDLNFFITPVTYLVLGYYLSKKEFKLSPNKMVVCSLVIFIASSILKMKFGNAFYIYPVVKVMYSSLDFSILQILQCASMFLLIRYIYSDVTGWALSIKKMLESKYMDKMILSVSRASYGIYLVHMLIMRQWIRPIFKSMGLSGGKMLLVCFATFVLLFLSTWIITLILGKIPYINKFSGYY